MNQNEMDKIKEDYFKLNIALGETVQQQAILENRKNIILKDISKLQEKAASLETTNTDQTSESK